MVKLNVCWIHHVACQMTLTQLKVELYCKTMFMFIIVIHMQTLSQQRPRDCDS